jgi:copper chaperone
MEQIKMRINGMHCGKCVSSVETVLKAMPGVEVEKVEQGEAVIRRDPQAAPDDVIRDALAARGFDLVRSEE